MIPSDWECEENYFLFKALVLHLIMLPFAKCDNLKEVKDNYFHVTKTTHYKNKLSKEVQEEIKIEFNKSLTLCGAKVSFKSNVFFSYSFPFFFKFD